MLPPITTADRTHVTIIIQSADIFISTFLFLGSCSGVCWGWVCRLRSGRAGLRLPPSPHETETRERERESRAEQSNNTSMRAQALSHASSHTKQAPSSCFFSFGTLTPHAFFVILFSCGIASYEYCATASSVSSCKIRCEICLYHVQKQMKHVADPAACKCCPNIAGCRANESCS